MPATYALSSVHAPPRSPPGRQGLAHRVWPSALRRRRSDHGLTRPLLARDEQREREHPKPTGAELTPA
jgi:hypothetical protein